MKTGKKIAAAVLAAVMVLLLVPAVPSQAAGRGFTFTSKGATIYVGANATNFIKKQGTRGRKVANKGDCHGTGGEDKTYTYGGFVLDTHAKRPGGTEYVQQIELRSKSVKTDKGIKIGSSRRQLARKYGRTRGSNGTYTYTKGSSVLIFKVKGGKVSAIIYA